MERDPEAILDDDRAVRGLARELVFDPNRIEDATQDAWLTALRTGPREAGARRSWLGGAVRRLLWRGHRGEERRTRHEHGAARREAEPSVADILEREAVRRRVVTAVVELAEPYRRAMLLRYFEGLAPREIAERLEVPVETVRTRLKRALAMLRSELDGEYGERATWCVILAPLAFGPGIAASLPAASLVHQALEGALIMSIKTKAALGTLALLLGALAVWLTLSDGRPNRLAVDPADPTTSAAPDRSQPLRLAPPDDDAEESPAVIPPPAAQGVATEERPRVAASVEPFGRLEIEVVWSDGTRAADVPITLLPFGVRDPFFRELHTKTDATGMFEQPSWPVGTTIVSCELGGDARAAVAGGETTRARLDIPAGMRVAGRVLDHLGAPVSGADIHVADIGHPYSHVPVAKTDLDGRFAIRELGGMLSVVGARCDGHAPSPGAILSSTKGVERQLELVLGGPGGAIDLLVVDPNGEPVAGARALVGDTPHDQFQLPDGTQACTPPDMDVRSGRDGHARVGGLAPGTVPIQLRGSGFAPQSVEVVVRAGTTTHQRVVLTTGGVVFGRILGSGGAPAVRVPVQIGPYGDVASHWARTDAEGRYRLEDVAPGEREIAAETDERGRVDGKVTVRADEETRWDGRLELGASITGLVTDSSGNPLDGYGLMFMAFSDGRVGSLFAKTDADGRFEAQNAHPGRYRVEVRTKNGIDTLYTHPSTVEPGSTPLHFVIPAESIGEGTLIGRVLGHDGRPLGGAELGPLRAGISGGATHRSEAETGRFSIAGLPPGDYSLWVDAPNHGGQIFRSFRVEDGAETDVGALRLDEPGRIEVVALGLSALPDVTARFWARRPDRSNETFELTGERTVSSPLSPGTWTTMLEGDGLATRQGSVEVTSGATATVTFDVVPGRRVDFVITVGEGTAPLGNATVVLRRADGQEIHREERRPWQGRITSRFGLAAGAHTIAVTGADGRTASRTIGADESGGFALELR